MKITPALLLTTVLLMTACTGGQNSPEGLKKRVAALEKRIVTMETDNERQMTALRSDIAKLSQAIGKLSDALIKDGKVTQKKSDPAMERKARKFVDEALDGLLRMTKKLLNRIEEDMDSKAKKPKTPPVTDEKAI